MYALCPICGEPVPFSVIPGRKGTETTPAEAIEFEFGTHICPREDSASYWARMSDRAILSLIEGATETDLERRFGR